MALYVSNSHRACQWRSRCDWCSVEVLLYFERRKRYRTNKGCRSEFSHWTYSNVAFLFLLFMNATEYKYITVYLSARGWSKCFTPSYVRYKHYHAVMLFDQIRCPIRSHSSRRAHRVPIDDRVSFFVLFVSCFFFVTRFGRLLSLCMDLQ